MVEGSANRVINRAYAVLGTPSPRDVDLSVVTWHLTHVLTHMMKALTKQAEMFPAFLASDTCFRR